MWSQAEILCNMYAIGLYPVDIPRMDTAENIKPTQSMWIAILGSCWQAKVFGTDTIIPIGKPNFIKNLEICGWQTIKRNIHFPQWVPMYGVIYPEENDRVHSASL